MHKVNIMSLKSAVANATFSTVITDSLGNVTKLLSTTNQIIGTTEAVAELAYLKVNGIRENVRGLEEFNVKIRESKSTEGAKEIKRIEEDKTLTFADRIAALEAARNICYPD